MFKSILSKVGWGELPSSFGYTVGDKVDVPFSWHWELHKGQKKSDGSPASVFICGKKDLDSAQVAAAKNAVQMAKSLRHTHILRALDSIEVEGGFYLVTEQVVPLLSQEAVDGDAREPAVWGLYQVLDALSFLHQSSFAHGLFGPASVFVTPKGDYRLGGFELCRKDADATALLVQRRRSGPGLVGWPDPPACLQDGGAPTVGVDLWGAALMAAYVFGTAKSGRRGVDFRVDMAKAAQDLPPELRKPFAELSKPGPLRGRSPIAELLRNPFFQQDASVKVMSFLGSLHIRSPEEKDAFFDSLPGLLESVPQWMQTRQVLPELLEAQKFPGQEAAQVLPSILKIGIRLKDEEFREKVAPLVAQLFASPDRAIRFRLLTSLGEMIDHLDDRMINEKIFPECVNGFTDSNGPIREATVKSLIHFVPRLKAQTVESRVVKLLVKLLQDPESSIRTNAVICCGRVSGHLPKTVASQTLATVVAAGLKDTFGPCRNASLQTLLATCSLFTVEELATRMMPGVCHRLVDPDPGVGDTAFHVLSSLQQHVRQLVEERRAQQGMDPGVKDAGPGGAAAAGGGGDAAREGGGWGSWALSTVGSVVGQKIMGSMGPSKADGPAGGAAPQGAGAAPTQAAAPPEASPPGAPARGGGGGRGMSLAARPAAPAAAGSRGAGTVAPGSATSGFDGDDDVDAGGAGWGDGDEFWGEFGDVPAKVDAEEDEDDHVAPPAPTPRSRASTAPQPATAAPASAPAPAPAARPLPGASQAKAKAAPKADVKALQSKEDEDFWKEFDM